MDDKHPLTSIEQLTKQFPEIKRKQEVSAKTGAGTRRAVCSTGALLSLSLSLSRTVTLGVRELFEAIYRSVPKVTIVQAPGYVWR